MGQTLGHCNHQIERLSRRFLTSKFKGCGNCFRTAPFWHKNLQRGSTFRNSFEAITRSACLETLTVRQCQKSVPACHPDIRQFFDRTGSVRRLVFYAIRSQHVADALIGNSGGPVFDAKTGKLYGHTISTQSEVAGSLQEMTEWENEYLSKSSNYADCKTINKELATRVPTDEFYRLHPKWLRMFLAPNPMISNVTHICPGDFGPNKQPGSTTAVPESTESVVFNRLRFNTEDVYWKNLSGRVDRLAIFLTDIDKLCTRFEGCKLQIRIWGPRYFARPPPKSTLSLLLNGTKWPITLDSLTEDTNSTALRKSYTQTVDLKTLAKRQAIPAKTPSSAPGLLAWTEVELQSPFIKCEPSGIGFDLVVQRASFNFPVNATWPPGRADITANPSDANLKWPAEDFHFATTVGDPGSKLRKGVGLSSYALNQNKARGYWTWTADMDKVWTNPRQPPQGMGDNPADTLLNEIMEDRDPNLG